MASELGKLDYAFEDNIIKPPEVDYEPEEGGLGPLLFKSMKINSDKIAQIDTITDEKETFGNLLKRSIRASLHMAAKGIKREHNHLVCICSNNNLDTPVPYLASIFLGIKIACVDPKQSKRELTHLVNLVKPKLLFSVPQSVETLERIIKDNSLDTEIVVFGASSNHTEFSTFLVPLENEEKFTPYFADNLKETVLVHFSSGTSGLPKGICLTHYGIRCAMHYNSLIANPDYAKMQEDQTRLSLPPALMSYASLCWISSAVALISSICFGMARLLCNNFDVETSWEIIRKYKPFILTLIPASAIEMCRNGKPPGVDTSSLLRLLLTGSSISKENILKIREVLPETDVHQIYGQTELSSIVLGFQATDLIHQRLFQAKPESIGVPMRGFIYKVVDLQTGEALGPNKKGEIRVKTRTVMNGYFGQDSAECYDKDGWFKTGDLGYYDEDFCFFIVDRVRELIKYKGWHVTPTLLEIELTNHPAVKEAIVIGIRHEEDGDHPMGVVVIHEDSKHVTEEELEKFVEDRVPEQQRLRAGVKIIDKMPMTHSGKVNRRAVARMFKKD